MKLSTLLTTAVFAGAWTSTPALAAEFGSPKEAKETDPVQKVSYVTRIGDQICGVGYYKP
jgi:uncharacterized transporter YbjL